MKLIRFPPGNMSYIIPDKESICPERSRSRSGNRLYIGCVYFQGVLASCFFSRGRLCIHTYGGSIRAGTFVYLKRERPFFSVGARPSVTCRTIWPAVGFVSQWFDLIKAFFLRLDGQQKGGRGYHERYFGTCRFVNEVNTARRSQLAAAVCTEQHQNLMEVASGGDKATARS